MPSVLHSGETEDDLFDDDGNVIAPNCTTGGLPSVTGFTVSGDGQLDPIPNSTQQLSGDSFSGCAQVSFNPSGDVLVVTERTAVQPGLDNNQAPAGDEGVIVTFNVNGDGTLNATSESADNGGTDTCWFVVTDDGNVGFASSFFNPTPRISSYSISDSGDLQILQADAAVTEQGTADLALSSDSEYFYNINSFNGTIEVFDIGDDGSLTSIQTVQAHDPSDMAAVIGIAAI